MGCCSSSEESILLPLQLKDVPPFVPSFKRCKVVKVYDGDTITVCGIIHGKPYEFSVRMFGYDSPELKTKNPLEKKAAIEAKNCLSNRILGKIVNISIQEKREKYGRLLATISDNEGEINSWMLRMGHGVPYFGRKKISFEFKGPDESK